MADGVQIQDRDPLTVPSTRRNPLLADIFNRLGYMERKGSGFEKIINGYEFQVTFEESKKPRFYSDRSQFRTIMPNLNYGLQSTGVQLVDATNQTNQTQTELTEVQTRIINIIKGNDKITQKEMSIELDIPESSVKYHVMALRKKGIIKREGTIHNGHWIIMKTE